MKKFSKILSVALLVALVLSLGVANAFAEQATATISFPTNTDFSEHTYEIYQIYVGDVDPDNAQGLLNIKYGANHKTGTAGDAVSQSEIEELSDIAATTKNVKDLEDLLAVKGYVDLTGTPYKTLTKTNTSEEVPTGYYLIKDQNNSLTGQEDSYTLYLLEVVQDDITITPKADIPHDKKEVGDINDSTETTHTLGTSADHDIGDMVPYTLTATTASNVSSYTKYHVTFQDAQSKGLTAPSSFTVSVLGQTITLNNTVGATGTASTDNTVITATVVAPDSALVVPEGGNSFAIKVGFAPKSTEENAALVAECNSTDIVVTYQSELNENAKIGKDGNPNTSYITYSNNPNSSDDSEEGKTPPKTAIVFTYKFELDKVDQDYAGLNGAGFVMLKKLADQSVEATLTVADATKYAELKDVAAEAIVSYAGTKYEVVKNWGVQTSGYEFTYKGIDDGDYVIVETVVPKGYNHAEDIAFTVTADHSDQTLKSLTSSNAAVKANKDGGTFDFGEVEGKKNTIDAGTEAAVVTSVINNSGTQLPSTGGIGTTIFYVVGGVLVLAAIILLVTKKRMSE